MLARWPIRKKLSFGLALLLVSVATLSGSGFHGLYAYRGLVKSLGRRSAELPLAAELNQRVSDLRLALASKPLPVMGEGARRQTFAVNGDEQSPSFDDAVLRAHLAAVDEALLRYTLQLKDSAERHPRIGDASQEWRTVGEIEQARERIDGKTSARSWLSDSAARAWLSRELETLQGLTAGLPNHLHEEIRHVSDQVRGQYRTLIVLSWITTVAAAIMLGLLVHLFYKWIFRPLRVLIKGSRKVASGQFDYRIRLETNDEMAELALAMNDMTERFQAIRDDLDRQVQLRTKQVVRSEQLASVGFLAAGVAHEINNPLAAIAMSAESLERRLRATSFADNDQQSLAVRYLEMIQSEAFRCKQITEKLLDFSRTGEVRRQPAELRSLLQGVIEMVSRLGRYRDKHVELAEGRPVIADVNAQEIKQVALNLIANGLDSLDEGGSLMVEVRQAGDQVQLVFTDNGCGMTAEVLEHLFEPFFTRRKGGQGTGLGLSITYRIIQEHQGHIEAASDGPGRGSRFVVTLPLTVEHKEQSHRRQQAA